MSSFVIGVIYFVGAMTALMQLLLVFFIIATISSADLREWLHERLGRHGVLVALTIVGGSIVGSLFFSEVAQFPACFLCWIERALMYPEIILFGWYLYKPHKSLLYTALAMSVAGFLVSGYQILLENGSAPDLIPCTTLISLVSCATKYINLFGFLTIPVMAITVFAALIAVLIVVLHRKHWLPRKAAKYAHLS